MDADEIKSLVCALVDMPRTHDVVVDIGRRLAVIENEIKGQSTLIHHLSELTNVQGHADDKKFMNNPEIPTVNLEQENHELRVELQRLQVWLDSITVLSSKTSYGEMLISAFDRVQRSRFIPEVNYEEHLLSDIVQFLGEAYGFICTTFVDIGSNIGTQSVYMLKKQLANKVIAIEPDPTNYKLLRCNFIINEVEQSAVAINCALGDRDGEVSFELSKDNMGDHRVRVREFEGWVQNEQYRDVIKVNMLCPKSAFEGYRLDYSETLVWLDAQGLEGHILTSFFEGNQNVKYFVCEFWPYGIECVGGREKLFEIFEGCEAILDIRNMRGGQELTTTYLQSYYNESVRNEANHKVFSIDLVCIMKDKVESAII